MTVQIERHLFTTAEYEEMVSAGILTENDKVELINGEIVEMTPIGIAHNAAVDRLNRLLNQATGTDAIVRVQSSIRLDDRSEPEPDISLLRPRDDFYGDAHPGPDDILLLIEVADTSLEFDRSVKLPLYARAGIPEVWLVDLNDERIEVHRTPEPGGYRTRDIYWRGDTLETSVQVLPPVAVVDILGPSEEDRP